MVEMAIDNKYDLKKIEKLESETTNDTDTVICPNCSSATVIFDKKRGERVCYECGYVIEEKIIDQGAEWRAYSSEETNERSRVGLPSSFTIHDKGLSTIIGYENRDHFGNKLTATRRSEIYRLRKWQLRSRTDSNLDRNLARAFSELDRLASQLSLPRNIVETAALVYRKAVDKKIIRGRGIDSMVAASVYSAARIRRIPRTLDEIADNSSVSKKDLAKSYRHLVLKLGINIPLADPMDYIARFGTQMRLSGLTQREAIGILKKANERGITAGKDPTGLAAAAIYIAGIKNAGEERHTQREISEVANVTEVTIRNRYKELVRELDIQIENLR
jgi:transcription initiation factor TFIIB